MSMHSIWTRTRRCAVLSVAFAAVAVSSCLAADRQSGSGTVLATIDGKPITEADVKKSASADFDSLEHEYAQKRYDLVQSSLDKLVEQRLIAAEAAKRGTTEEELLATVTTKTVTDTDVDLFYQQKQERLRRTKEKIGQQMREA